MKPLDLRHINFNYSKEKILSDYEERYKKFLISNHQDTDSLQYKNSVQLFDIGISTLFDLKNHQNSVLNLDNLCEYVQIKRLEENLHNNLLSEETRKKIKNYLTFTHSIDSKEIEKEEIKKEINGYHVMCMGSR